MTSLQIKYFIEVVKLGSITAAANEMYISQPTVSNQISALEKECGYKLLTRKQNGVELTEAGRIVYNCFIRIERDWITSHRDAARLASGSTDKLFIGYLNLLLSEQIQSCIREYRMNNSRLLLDMFCEDSAKLVSDLLTGDLDMALLFDSHIENIPEIDSAELMKSEYVIVMSPLHPLAKKQSVSPEELFECEFVFSHLNKYMIPNTEHKENPSTFGNLGSISKELGINPDNVKYQPNFESIFAQIEVNDGLTVVDEHVNLLWPERFVTISTGIYHGIVAAWRSSNQNAQLRPLIDYLEKNFRRYKRLLRR